MAENHDLKLVDQTQDNPYLLDRRRALRRSTAGRVTAVINSDGPDGPHHRLSSLNLHDMSTTGMGALSQEELPINATVAVLFPPHGPERGFDMFGTIVRCSNKDGRHEIGIRFTPSVMAA